MARALETSSILRRLLEAAGYRLSERPEGLIAVRRRDRRAVVIVAGSPSPAELERRFPAGSVHKTIVYSDDPGPVARSLASERGIEILDSATLGSALGEILLPSSLGIASASEMAQASSFPIEAPATVFPEGERTVVPRLTRSDAEALAAVDGFRYTLRLVPFFVAPYRVRVASALGGEGPTSDHLVAVNALSGRVEMWEEGERELVADIEDPHQRLEPQLSESRSRALAVEAIRRRHTVNIDHTEQHGGALVIETRRVPPGPDDVKVGPPVIVHVPYWYVEGAEGRVVLDAVTGLRAATEGNDPDSTV